MKITKICKQDLAPINLYELIGIIIGDGSIWNYPNKRVYGLQITGNATEDMGYFLKISGFIESLINKKPKIVVKTEGLGRSLRLAVYSKKFVKYLIHDLGITNINKTFTAKISDNYLNWKYSKHIIRGLFETDGCIYFSKSGGKIGYPRIEIKTSSVKLLEQVILLLEQNKFKPHVSTTQTGRTFKIYLSGEEMLERWRTEIGFGSIKNLTKYLLWRKLGYYIPRISLQDRLEILQNAPVAKRLITNA